MVSIALLYDRVRWEEKQIAEELQKLGVSVKWVDAREVPFELGVKAEGELNVDAVLQRCISHTRGIHSTAVLEAEGIKVINSFLTSFITSNKLITTLKLMSAGVPVPRTGVAFSLESALKVAAKIGYPLVVKPVVGSWGRLVQKARDRDELYSILESRELYQDPLLQVYYIQELVKRPPRDIRAIVVGGSIVAAIYRYQPEGDWRTNVARGGKAEKAQLKEEEKEVLIKASEAVGGGVLGVDAMESEEGILVHEVNGTVEFRGAASVWGNTIAKAIAEYAIEIAKR